MLGRRRNRYSFTHLAKNEGLNRQTDASGPQAAPRPGVLDTCVYLGFIYGERRWRNVQDDLIYTWDALHGEIEAYDRRGRHLGVLDAVSGEPIKPARKGRRIRV